MSKQLEPDLESALREALGPMGVLTGEDTKPYCTDWRDLFHGRARLVLRPSTTDQVSVAMAICAAHRVAVVTQGGNTGLVGGATPDASGASIVMLTSRLDRIRHIDATDMTMVAEAGTTLHSVRAAAGAAGLAFPLWVASGGTAQIGGILATNAGGNTTIRHGNARDLMLGLEVVLSDGRILHGLRRLRKDNTGYALRHLFVGSEGTLGIITAASLRLVTARSSSSVALVAVANPVEALALLRLLQEADDGALHAFEYISGAALRMVLEHSPGTQDPFRRSHPHYVLIELETARANVDLRVTLEALLSRAFELGIALDAVLAANQTQRAELWRLREDQADAQQRAGPTIKNDISVPVSATPELIALASAACIALSPGVRIVPFGHLGDGNIHFNLVAPPEQGADWLDQSGEALVHAVTQIARSLGGSFSAEHGIGQLKRDLLAEWRDGVELDAMRSIKAALDPLGLLNPGKVL